MGSRKELGSLSLETSGYFCALLIWEGNVKAERFINSESTDLR